MEEWFHDSNNKLEVINAQPQICCHRVQLVGELLLELLVRGSNPSGVGLLLGSIVRGWSPIDGELLLELLVRGSNPSGITLLPVTVVRG
jgi:hypothetical protein